MTAYVYQKYDNNVLAVNKAIAITK